MEGWLGSRFSLFPKNDPKELQEWTQKASKIDAKSSPEEERGAARKFVVFSMQREGERAEKNRFPQKSQKRRNLEKVDFVL